jgi:hypothetical protein
MRLALLWQFGHRLCNAPFQNDRASPWCSTTWSATVAGVTMLRFKHIRQSGSALSWARDLLRQRSSWYQSLHPRPLGLRERGLGPLPGPPTFRPSLWKAMKTGGTGAGEVGPAGARPLSSTEACSAVISPRRGNFQRAAHRRRAIFAFPDYKNPFTAEGYEILVHARRNLSTGSMSTNWSGVPCHAIISLTATP